VKAAASRIVQVDELDLDFVPRSWPFAVQRAGEIARHWRERIAAQPKLYDGRVLLLGAHELTTRRDGAAVLRGSYFEARFSAFLAWRDFGFPDAQVCNAFSMAALQSSDGAYLLGEMGVQTANAGSIYFASGTPDPQDIVADKVDLAASVRRELQEETGLAPSDVTMAAGWTVVYAPPRIACMKAMRIDMAASQARTRIEAFLARETEPELARMHVVGTVSDIDASRSPAFIVDYLRRAFGESQSSVG
jgi:8-oxo-dGTP pyrophosphatase MutT (NUDIX family)